MLFTEENGRRSKIFDFTTLPLGFELQAWLAAAFARATGPRGGVKKVRTAIGYFEVVRAFASILAASQLPPSRPQEITTAHIAAFRLALTPASFHNQVHKLRRLMREDEVLRPEVRRAVCEGRLHRRPLPKMLAYTDAERQQVLTAARGDVRRARDRIRAGRDLLVQYRRGELPPGSTEKTTGEALDVLDRTGALPRLAGGQTSRRLRALGGVKTLMPMLCVTRMEAAAFSVLLVDLTGENLGTIIEWPAVHFRPDGGQGSTQVALVEETKPRRGPSREHMVVAVEDLPASLAGAVEGNDEHRLFRSPLRVYQLLLDLSALARKHGGLSMAFSYLTVKGEAEKWQANMISGYVGEWAVRHGFPRASRGRSPAEGLGAPYTGQEPVSRGDKPCVHVQRLRQTALERRRRPIAHSASTLNDYYLRRSPQVLEDSRNIVREALDAEVAKARRVLEIPVFTHGFLERATTDPAGAAAEMGVDAETFKRILAGDQDTVLASCTDHHNGPGTPPGTVCDLSFLHCLSCPNARALAHQLPAQVTAYDRLAALRADLEPREWDLRYGEPFARLTDLLRNYSPQDQDDARSRVLPEDRDRVAALLDGRLDLR
ncbi:hypothetical protein [Streptomyces sp. NPDC006012]|uniref:hypothetical protein n=1 Tax=Streptomyces sp. NPDC006012 TaxID=3364739 RepID=UPI0036C5E57A